MQPLARVSNLGSAFSASAVLRQLTNPNPVQESWAFYVLDEDRNFKGDLSPLVDYAGTSPEVAHDVTRAVHRTLRLRMRGDADLDPRRDLIQPRYRLYMPQPVPGAAPPVMIPTASRWGVNLVEGVTPWAQGPSQNFSAPAAVTSLAPSAGEYVEWPLGVFSLVEPDRDIQPSRTWLDASCPDLSQLLVDAGFLQTWSAPKNASYVGQIRSIVDSAGLATVIPVEIPDLGHTLPAKLTWDRGTSRLQAINDLLSACAFFPAWVDENGALRSAPIPDWNEVEAVATFDATGNQAVALQSITTKADPSKQFNQVEVVGEDPRRVPIVARYVNDNPDSPISTARWTPRLQVVRDSAIHDEGTAWAKARALAQEAARIYSTFTHQSMAWPLSQDNDPVALTFQTPDEGLVDSLFLEVGWTMRCKAGHPTDHLITRLTPA